ncbi:MAG: hypothetical protein JJU45_16915 [Acidimicrobiia bacterium]|nr:hypothetical protein [Acidimicrobiia bacterium]
MSGDGDVSAAGQATSAGSDDRRVRPSRRRILGGAAGLVGGAAVVWSAPSVLSVSAVAAQTGCADLGVNLLECAGGAGLVEPDCFVGDPTFDPHVPQGTAPGPILNDPPWQVTNGLRVCDYGHVDMPTTGDLSPASAEVGDNLFCGSFSGAASPAEAVQRTDVVACASEIDAGDVTCTASAYLGGNPAVATTASLTVEFLSATDVVLGTLTVGPVDSTTLVATGLVLTEESASVPSSTRALRCTLSFAYPGVTPDRNTACADLLSVVLTT